MAKKLDIKKVLNKNNKKSATKSGGNFFSKSQAKFKKNAPIIVKNSGQSAPWYKNPTVWILGIVLAGVVLIKVLSGDSNNTVKDYGEFLRGIKDGKYETVQVYDFSVEAKVKDQNNQTVTSGIPSKSVFFQNLRDAGINVEDKNTTPIKFIEPAAVDFASLIPSVVIIFGAIFLLIYFLSKQGAAGGGSSGIFGMGESKARMVFGKKQDIGFDSVAGVDESKEELKEVVDFLKNPTKYTRMGARIPKGVLLVGEPGTGKTLLARAVSGEAGVPFFFVAGSEFEELLVGAGAARVRDLFSKAKKAAPSIIFIDEIDAMARKRGTVIQSTATEQTLNQILVEMDGFDNNTGIIVLAATNRPDVLDPAILRPGRFDRRVTLEIPDKDARRQILDVHVKNKPLSSDIDLEVIAKRTAGFSGADLENMLNEAAIMTAKAGRNEITRADIEESVAKITMGPAKRRVATEKDRKITAYHEAGHAIVGFITGVDRDVHRITIVPRGMAGGYTEYIPQEDNKLLSEEKLLSSITSMLAGNATERLIFSATTTGASDDFQKATKFARYLVTKYGMGDIGPMVLSDSEDEMNYGTRQEFSNKTLEIVDANIQRILNECYEKATEVLKRYRNKLDTVVQVLFEKETIEGDEFKAIMLAD